MNYIEVASKPALRDVHRHIVAALHRNADIDAMNIRVDVAGDVVRLTGMVPSLRQREAAERGAASAPGIRRVENRIVVAPAPVDDIDDEEIC